MTKIKYVNMGDKVALETLKKSMTFFERVLKGDKTIFDYGIPFDWSIIEKRHTEVASSDTYNCAFCFSDGKTRYSLDISKDIDSFGFNADYFNDLYGDISENLYCCEICTYRRAFTFNELSSETMFLYDRENNEVVEILELEKIGPKHYYPDSKRIRRVEDVKRLENILKASKSSQ